MPTIRVKSLIPNVKIFLTVKFNSNHYGHFIDLIQGVLNTASNSFDISRGNRTSAAIISRYVDIEGTPLIPNQTMSSNLDESNRIFGPYKDRIIPLEQVDRIEYIENTNDTVTTIIS